jgi:hypothetical protein
MPPRGVQVELPDEAKSRLDELNVLRESALDAMRAAQGRINLLPEDAGQLHQKYAAERDKHQRCQNDFHRLLSACNQWWAELRLPPGQCLAMADPPAVGLKPGETVFIAIDNVRREIASIQHRMLEVRRAPMKRSSQQEAVRKYLAGLALRSKPRVVFDAAGNAKVLFLEDIATMDTVVGLLALCFPTELTKALDFHVEPDAPNALSPIERAMKLGELANQLLILERHEARLLTEADGVLPRPEMNPVAYLGVEIVSMETISAVA